MILDALTEGVLANEIRNRAHESGAVGNGGVLANTSVIE